MSIMGTVISNGRVVSKTPAARDMYTWVYRLLRTTCIDALPPDLPSWAVNRWLEQRGSRARFLSNALKEYPIINRWERAALDSYLMRSDSVITIAQAVDMPALWQRVAEGVVRVSSFALPYASILFAQRIDGETHVSYRPGSLSWIKGDAPVRLQWLGYKGGR